jgi:DNA primase
MKGILKNTKAGWFVWYQVARDVITYGYDSIPLHPDSQTWMDGYNLYEGKEVEFEVRVYPSGTRYAKIIDEDDLGCSYPNCICQGNEIADCNNRTPKQRQTMRKVQIPDQVVLGDKTALVENIFHQELKKTAMQELIDEIVEHLTYDDGLTKESRESLETIRLRCLSKLTKEKEQMRKTYSYGWTTRERFDDLVPDIIYPLGLDYEEKQEYAFEQYYNNAYGK